MPANPLDTSAPPALQPPAGLTAGGYNAQPGVRPWGTSGGISRNADNSQVIALEPDPEVLGQEHPGMPARLWKSLLKPADDDTPGLFLRAPLFLKSLGTDRIFLLHTHEVSYHDIYVACREVGRYPFLPGKTIIEGTIHFDAHGEEPAVDVHFLGKIGKIHAESHGTSAPVAGPGAAMADTVPGFVLRIIQIDFDEQKTLFHVMASRTAAAVERGAS